MICSYKDQKCCKMRLVCVDSAGSVSRCDGASPRTILAKLQRPAGATTPPRLSCQGEGFLRHLARYHPASSDTQNEGNSFHNRIPRIQHGGVSHLSSGIAPASPAADQDQSVLVRSQLDPPNNTPCSSLTSPRHDPATWSENAAQFLLNEAELPLPFPSHRILGSPSLVSLASGTD